MTMTRPRPAPVRPQLEQAWTLYSDIFAEINTLAAQRHLMSAEEFTAVYHDRRVLKFYVHDQDGHLAGMSVLTQHLDAWPLISPQFFARRWPEHYARKAIWYVGFTGVTARQPHGFRELVRDMYTHISSNAGIAVMDCCTHNSARLRLPLITLKLLAGINPAASMQTADSQSFNVYHFDRPTGGA